MRRATANLSVDGALASARERYAAANPKSRAANERAQAVMPGGNTRSVLHFDPFPLVMVKGINAELFDLDGQATSILSASIRPDCSGILIRRSKLPFERRSRSEQCWHRRHGGKRILPD